LAGVLDEGLDAIMLLWSGEPVSFRGRYLTIDDVSMRPAPVQEPRVPIWVGVTWPRRGPARRAARWDGSVLIVGNTWEQPPDPAVIAEMHVSFHARTRIRQDEPFDLVAGGSTPDDLRMSDVVRRHSSGIGGSYARAAPGVGVSWSSFPLLLVASLPALLRSSGLRHLWRCDGDDNDQYPGWA
jgi:Luciferase-like monooxygenase